MPSASSSSNWKAHARELSKSILTEPSFMAGGRAGTSRDSSGGVLFSAVQQTHGFKGAERDEDNACLFG